MGDKQPKRFPFSFEDINRLIEMLDQLDRGVIAEKVRLEPIRDPSYVSKQKAALVDLLNDPVLEEGGAEGKQLTTRAKEFLKAVRQAKEVVAAALVPERFGSTRLRLGSIPSVLASFMPYVFGELAESDYFGHHSHVAIHTESGTARELFDRLDKGLLDMVITYPLRDDKLGTRPDKKTEKRKGTREWHPVQMESWVGSGDIHEFALFQGRPVGLIYHKSNTAMADLAAASRAFSFKPLARMIVFLTSDPNQPAFEAEIESHLPQPETADGTRVYLQTFSQIRSALRSGGEALRKKAVGVGAEPDRDEGLEFLNFQLLEQRCEKGSSVRRAVARLAELSTQQFYAYRKSAESRPVVRLPYFRDFAAAVMVAGEKYQTPHTYLS